MSKTLAQKVKIFLNLGDEGKLVRFEGKFNKFIEKQIKIKEEAIESLKDKASDAKDALNDVILNVDIENIKTTEGAEAYCSSYVGEIESKLDAVDNFKEEIADLEAEIKKLKEIKATVEAVDISSIENAKTN